MLKKYNFSPNTTKLTNPSFPKIKNVTLIMYENYLYLDTYTWTYPAIQVCLFLGLILTAKGL